MLGSVQTSCRRDNSFLDVFLKPPTMSLSRNLAEATKADQFPKIPFIPRSDYSRFLSALRCVFCRRREPQGFLLAARDLFPAAIYSCGA